MLPATSIPPTDHLFTTKALQTLFQPFLCVHCGIKRRRRMQSWRHWRLKGTPGSPLLTAQRFLFLFPPPKVAGSSSPTGRSSSASPTTRGTLVEPGFCVQRGGDGGAAPSAARFDAQDGCAPKVRQRRARRFSITRRVPLLPRDDHRLRREKSELLSPAVSNASPGGLRHLRRTAVRARKSNTTDGFAGRRATRADDSRGAPARIPVSPVRLLEIALRPVRTPWVAHDRASPPPQLPRSFALSLRACRRLLQTVSFSRGCLSPAPLSHGYKPASADINTGRA